MLNPDQEAGIIEGSVIYNAEADLSVTVSYVISIRMMPYP